MTLLRLAFLVALAVCAGAATAAERPLPIGYLELEDDPRYDPRAVAARYPAQPWGRPFDGARVASRSRSSPRPRRGSSST